MYNNCAAVCVINWRRRWRLWWWWLRYFDSSKNNEISTGVRST